MTSDIVQAVRAGFDREPRLRDGGRAIRASIDHGDLVLEGEVGDVAAKKLALEIAAATGGVDRIIDRLHVVPAVRLPDADIRDSVCSAILSEPALDGYEVLTRTDGKSAVARPASAGQRGTIEVRVDDGVVTLDGEVATIRDKRLAGVVAWKTPGTRDVVDGLGASSGDVDDDDETTLGVRIALERDPSVDPSTIRVSAHGGIVELEGTVRDEAERHGAEMDAWCVFGVDRVENRLVVG